MSNALARRKLTIAMLFLDFLGAAALTELILQVVQPLDQSPHMLSGSHASVILVEC